MAEIDTPELILAVQLKNFEQVQSLLAKEDVNVNITDSFGDSALHYAAASNQLEILNLLIEKGANMNIQNSTGATPLHKAAGRNNRKIIETLLGKADSTIKTNSGLLPEQFTSDNDIWKMIIGQTNLKREKIFVENDNLGALIGKNGKNLQQLQTSSNTRIMIHKNNNASDRGNTEVSINGREESIALAKDLITDSIKPKPSKQEQLLEEENISHKVKVATKIPKNKFGKIIGAKGKKIAEIEENFGVKVVIPKFQDDEVVSIYGEDSGSVQDALNFIFELIKDKPNDNNNRNYNNRNNNSNNNNSNNRNNGNNNNNNRNNNNNNKTNGEGRRNPSPKPNLSPSGSKNAQVIHKDNTVVIKTNNYLRINTK